MQKAQGLNWVIKNIGEKVMLLDVNVKNVKI